ncbi:MAG: bifunctional riboflavin kinase/FAD synthetase [Ignavibacteriaceae bacterium]|nr:bifunctional riboflavin kinase/FAD synthetase [Ignavibacteriaceae bacterium]
MNIYRSIQEVGFDKKTALTIGTFDGLHLGHQEILSVLKNKAAEKGLRSFVVTFEPHPRTVVIGLGSPLHLITTIEEKTELFEKAGVENLLIINFTEEFSQTPPEVFFREYIIDKIGVTSCIIGYDHRFGKGRDGGEDIIRGLAAANSFDVTTVGAVQIGDIIISSSKIRHLLFEGETGLVHKMLGRNFSLLGHVVKGDQRGRLLGFPTANIRLSNKDKIIPGVGVYAVKAEVEGTAYNSVMNVGYRPTFVTGELTIEVHLLGFDGDLYDKEMKVTVLERMRGEKKFISKNDLIEQIKTDIQKAKDFFNN